MPERKPLTPPQRQDFLDTPDEFMPVEAPEAAEPDEATQAAIDQLQDTMRKIDENAPKN